MKTIGTSLAFAALLMAAGTAQAAKLQCWTDKDGKRACGDRVPPEYAQKEREVRDAQGRVVERKQRQRTPEEVATERAKQMAEVAERDRFQRQKAYDQYLLQSFGSIGEMEGVRDSRVSTLEGRIKLAEKSIADTEKSLGTLKARAEATQKADKPVDAKLAKQIKEFEASLVDGLQGAAALRTERENVETKFTADVLRYKQLRQGLVQMGSPTSDVQPATIGAAKP